MNLQEESSPLPQETFVQNVMISQEESESVKLKVMAGFMSEDGMRDAGMKEPLEADHLILFFLGFGNTS